MKLELPNGIALFLWEDEVERINLLETHIEVVKPSGRTLNITLSEHWLKNKSRNLTATPSAPQLLSPSSQNDRESPPLQIQLPATDLVPKPQINNQSLQILRDEFDKAIGKFEKLHEVNQEKMVTLKKEMDTDAANLKKQMNQFEIDQVANFQLMHENILNLNSTLQVLAEGLPDKLDSTPQEENGEPQGGSKKKKKRG